MGGLDRIFRRRAAFQQRPLAAIVASLWRNGEQGVEYDIPGFRDSWESVGPNLLTNGGFDSATGWLQNTGWSIAGGVATFNNTSGASQSLLAGLYKDVGKWYLIEFDLFITSGSVDVAWGSSPAVIFSSSGRCRFLHFRQSNYGLYFYAKNNSSGYIDNVEVKEWFGVNSCALFQDAAGTLPAYMPGQGQVDPPVGLLLEKRLGLVRGPEMLENGDFAAGPTSWTVSNADATHVATFSGGTLRYQSDTTSPVLQLSQVLPGGGQIKAGSWYEVTVVVSSWVSGGLKTDNLVGASTSGLVLASGPGVYRAIGLATTTITTFSIVRNSANVDITIDSISLRGLKGNHAYQTTTTSRPTLSARYNLLTATENFASTPAWTNLVGGTGSTPTRTANHAMAPNGTMTATLVSLALNGGTSPGDRSGFGQANIPITTGTTYSGGVWLKAATSSDVGKTVLLRHVAGTTYWPCTLTESWALHGRNEVAGASATGIFGIELRATFGGSADSVDLLVWGADLRVSNDGVGLPPYQRVVDANTYDVAGFPLYLRFDGVDDFMVTGNVDFSGVTEVFVMAAARKLSDASRGIIMELGANGYGQPGSFNLEQAWFSPNWSASYSGVTGSSTVTEPGIGAPASAVVGYQANQAAPSIQLRYQGRVRPASTAAVGGGGFLNAPIYIGRRGGVSSPANMRLYGLVIRARASSQAQIAAVEKLLNSKARIY